MERKTLTDNVTFEEAQQTAFDFVMKVEEDVMMIYHNRAEGIKEHSGENCPCNPRVEIVKYKK